jgi:hypothetical protein
VDELDGRSHVRSQSTRRRAGWAGVAIVAFGVLVLAGSACGSTSTASGASSTVTTIGDGAVADTSQTTPRLSVAAPLLAAKPTCPVSVTTISTILGARVHEEPSGASGSCAFDSIPGGQGLSPAEIRVVIEVGPNDLSSLYGFFSPQVAKGLPSCRPYRLVDQPVLGPGAFETTCGATATAGPSSADEYFPLQDHRQLTVTVNRGLGVPDHQVATCEAEIAALVKLIHASW